MLDTLLPAFDERAEGAYVTLLLVKNGDLTSAWSLQSGPVEFVDESGPCLCVEPGRVLVGLSDRDVVPQRQWRPTSTSTKIGQWTLHSKYTDK